MLKVCKIKRLLTGLGRVQFVLKYTGISRCSLLCRDSSTSSKMEKVPDLENCNRIDTTQKLSLSKSFLKPTSVGTL